MPDVRNKALIYWRLLTLSRDEAREVIVRECLFGEKSDTNDSNVPSQFFREDFDKPSLNVLIENMGRVSGVFHVLPEDFVKGQLFNGDDQNDDFLGLDMANGENHRNISVFESGKSGSNITNSALIDVAQSIHNSLIRNWKKAVIQDDDDVVDIFTDWEENKLYVKVVNKSYESNFGLLSNFAIALNTNCLGLAMDTEKGPVTFPQQIGYGESFEICLNLKSDQNALNFENTKVQAALRTSNGTKMFDIQIDLSYFASQVNQPFDSVWNAANGGELSELLEECEVADSPILSGRGLTVTDKIENGPAVSFRILFCLPINNIFAAVVSSQPEGNKVGVQLRGNNSALFPLIKENLKNLFCKESNLV